MKSSELRLGNMFNEQYSGQLLKVIGLSGAVITFDGNFKGKWQAEPIPLTEEWLLKFGFSKRDDNYELLVDELNLEVSLIDFIENWSVYLSGPFGMVNTKKINYLHQLQNLYFALTGTELNVPADYSPAQ